MQFERFYDDKLAQASYLIGCVMTGEALVVDPNRDLQRYITTAQRHGLHITHVTETHIHADFLSGARELAHRTGATLYLSDEGGPDWQYGFADEPNVVRVKDGDTINVGNVRITVLHTPGHTPEHISFLVTDTVATDEPMGMLTGDFVFVGDVGRPDLLEKAAGVSGTMEAGARQLFESIRRFKTYPNHLQIWPGHGAGSACGKALSAVPQSTLGYERTVNWALQIDDEDKFVEAVLEGQPEPPKYFARMKAVNRDGPPIEKGETPVALTTEELDHLIQEGAFIVDTRPWSEFAAGHIAGTISIPLDSLFTTYAGWFVPYDREFYLIVDLANPELTQARRHLRSIGLDRLRGFADRETLTSWVEADHRLETAAEIEAAELATRDRPDVTIVDVRGRSEWDAGHVPHAVHIPLGYLPDRLSELPAEGQAVLMCETGVRSAIGTSVLRALGYDRVVNAVGGINAWRREGLPVEMPEGQLTTV